MVNVRVWVSDSHIDIKGSSYRFTNRLFDDDGNVAAGEAFLEVINEEDGHESKTMFNLTQVVGFDIRVIDDGKGGEK